MVLHFVGLTIEACPVVLVTSTVPVEDILDEDFPPLPDISDRVYVLAILGLQKFEHLVILVGECSV